MITACAVNCGDCDAANCCKARTMKERARSCSRGGRGGAEMGVTDEGLEGEWGGQGVAPAHARARRNCANKREKASVQCSTIMEVSGDSITWLWHVYPQHLQLPAQTCDDSKAAV